MMQRTFTGILLGPTGNIQGSQVVFDVDTGAYKKARVLSRMVMPDRIIKAVHAWAHRSARKDPENSLVFLNRNKDNFGWGDEDHSTTKESIP